MSMVDRMKKFVKLHIKWMILGVVFSLGIMAAFLFIGKKPEIEETQEGSKRISEAVTNRDESTDGKSKGATEGTKKTVSSKKTASEKTEGEETLGEEETVPETPEEASSSYARESIAASRDSGRAAEETAPTLSPATQKTQSTWASAYYEEVLQNINSRRSGVDYDGIIAAVGNAGASDQAEEWLLNQNGGFSRKATDKKVIYLTFCMGTEVEVDTASVLNVLAAYNVKASFFVVGAEYFLPDNETLVKRIVNEGHILGNHGFTHICTANLSDVRLINEVLAWNEAVSDILGYSYKAVFYRPPSGDFRARGVSIAQAMGMKPIGYSFNYPDFDGNANRSAASALSYLQSGLCEGAVYYLHPTPCNAAALGSFIDYARSLGYTFLRIDQEPSEAETEASSTEESSSEASTEESCSEASTEESCSEASTEESSAETSTAESPSETVVESDTADESSEESTAEAYPLPFSL